MSLSASSRSHLSRASASVRRNSNIDCGKRRVDDDVTHGCHRIRCEATASSRDRDFCRVMASTTSRLRIWLGWADINDGIQFQLTSSSSAHFKSTYPNLRTKRCSTVSLFDRRYIISQRVSAFHRYCHHDYLCPLAVGLHRPPSTQEVRI